MGRVRYFGGAAQGAVRIGNNAGLVDAEVIVLGVVPGNGQRYEWDTPDGVVAGNIAVVIGANAAASIVNLITAINNNKPIPNVSAFVDPKDSAVCRIEADARGTLGNMIFTTDMVDGANVITGAGTLLNGENALNQVIARCEHTVDAIDVSAGNIMLSTGLPATPRFAQLELRTAAGARKVSDMLQTIEGTRVRLDFQAGTDPVAGDKIVLYAYE